MENKVDKHVMALILFLFFCVALVFVTNGTCWVSHDFQRIGKPMNWISKIQENDPNAKIICVKCGLTPEEAVKK